MNKDIKKKIDLLIRFLVEDGAFPNASAVIDEALLQYMKREQVKTLAVQALLKREMTPDGIYAFMNEIGDARMTGKCLRKAQAVINHVQHFVDQYAKE